jgi:hypothetical protein
MKQLKRNISLTISVILPLALHAAEPSSLAQQVLAVLNAQATTENLKLILGNGQSAVKYWQVPAHDTLKIVAEGGITQIRTSRDEPRMIFEVHGDANILEHFTATLTPEGEFRVLPQEGLLLVSHTPVVLHLRMPNGSLPRMSTQVGKRVISLKSAN